MQIQEQQQGAVTVLRPVGPLVEADAIQFKEHLLQVRGQSMGRFIVDASAVPYVDSTGLETLVDVQDELSQSGQSLKLCGINATIREVLSLTELTSRFEHFEDSKSAVRSFL